MFPTNQPMGKHDPLGGGNKLNIVLFSLFHVFNLRLNVFTGDHFYLKSE